MDGRTSEKLLDFKLVQNQFDEDMYNSNKMQESHFLRKSKKSENVS